MAVGKASLKRAAKAAEIEPKKEETKVAAEEKAEEAKPKTTRKRKPAAAKTTASKAATAKTAASEPAEPVKAAETKPEEPEKAAESAKNDRHIPFYKRASGLSSVIVCAIFSQLREICRCFTLFYVKFLAIQNKLWYNLC